MTLSWMKVIGMNSGRRSYTGARRKYRPCLRRKEVHSLSIHRSRVAFIICEANVTQLMIRRKGLYLSKWKSLGHGELPPLLALTIGNKTRTRAHD